MKRTILIFVLLIYFSGGAAMAQKGPPSPETLADYDKAYEEYLRKLAEVQEKNKQIAENNRKISDALAEGAKAYVEKNYQLAAEKFDEGYRVDPGYWGTAPVFLSNKAMALKMLGVEKYNRAVIEKTSPAEANQYFLEAISALKESQRILGTSPETLDENQKKTIEANVYIAVSQVAECYKLLLFTDKTRIYETIEAFENYIKIMPQDYKKQQVEETLRQIKTQFNIPY